MKLKQRSKPWQKKMARAGIVVGMLVMTIGCDVQSRNSPPVDRPTEPVQVSVHVAEVQRMTMKPTLELVGSITAIPEKTAVISPQAGGWVVKLDVAEGQAVQSGQILVELDSRSAQVNQQRAAAIVAEKDAALKRLQSGYLPEEIAGAKQDAGNAEATVEALKNELDALKNLLDRNEISKVVYETKAKALASAEAAQASVAERVKLLEAGTRPELVAEAKALLDAAKADLEQARLAVAWCQISSPIDGIVVQLLARQGQFFDRAVPLATVMDLSEVFAPIRIPGKYYSQIHTGTRIDLTASSVPNQTFSGTIARIGGEADLATGNLIVFAKVGNPEGLLRPGLSCQVTVYLPELADTLAVPVAAIADHSGTSVVTVIRNGKAFETEVQLGIHSQDHVQVLSGLSAGELVAVSGGYGLPEGTPVAVIQAGPPGTGQ